MSGTYGRLAAATLLFIFGTSSLAAQALAGKRIVVSAGHGYYWHSSLGWITQRPLIDGLIEDVHTNEIMMDYLVPWLEGAGATVISCRARTRTDAEWVLNNDQGAPNYTETGAWSTSGSQGFGGGTYRFAATSPAGGVTATFSATITKTEIYPIYIAYRSGANRTTAARVIVTHAGGTSTRFVDQTRDDLRWVFVGEFPYVAGDVATVTLSNLSTVPGILVADAVKIGDGMGSISRGGTTSGQPRWRECSRYHAQYFGAPASIYDPLSTGQDNGDDVTCRPLYGEWWEGDLYISLHTNAGGGSGTSTFIHNTAPTAGSAAFQSALHTRLIADLRAGWDPAWQDDGQQSANFGEVRELSTMPGVLVELAFHDDLGGDIEAIHHPRFRRLAGRAMYRGIASYLAPSQPWALDPPVSVSLRNNGQGDLVLSWVPIAGATAYLVRTSRDGFGFDDGVVVSGSSYTLPDVFFDEFRFATVSCINSGGTGVPSERVGARLAPGGTAPLLLVQGFDRHDRSVKEKDNKHDGLIVDGAAIAVLSVAGYPVDGATNEAVQQQLAPLPGYTCVGWILGEESTVDESFSSFEQLLIQNYLNLGGRFFYSGAEVGWDLDLLGSAADRAFYENVLGQNYVADDAGVYTTQALNTGPLAPLPAMTFDNGTAGIYNVDFPDVVAPIGGGQIVLRYSTGTGAAVLNAAGNVLGFGFPLQALVQPGERALVMERVLRLLCPLPLEIRVPMAQNQINPIDLEFRSSPNETFVVVGSLIPYPGVPLGDGRFVPVNMDGLFAYILSPQPYFLNVVGPLDSFGRSQTFLNLPAVPGLTGFSFVLSAVSVAGGGAIHEIAPWYRVIIP